MHKIVYLPKARQDISDIVRYIAYNLHAPKAARDLLDSIDAAISLTAEFPQIYVILDDVIEIRRVVYAKMNLDKLGLSDN